MNAQAGVGCYSWGPGTVSYVFMVDRNNSLNIHWKGERCPYCFCFGPLAKPALTISRYELKLAG